MYVLKIKDQALEASKKFNAEAKNFTGERVKTLRSDTMGEFLLAAFSEVCEEAGI